MSYPIMLELTNKTCLIIGGGVVARRKAQHLLEADAQVTVISPVLHAAFPSVTHIADTYHERYLDEVKPYLIFAATDDPAVNEAVVADAQARHIWVNAADGTGDFSNMIVWAQSPLTVAIATDGASPILAKHLRQKVAQQMAVYAEFAAQIAALRAQMKVQVPDTTTRQDFWRQAFTETVFALVEADQAEAAYVQIERQYRELIGATT